MLCYDTIVMNITIYIRSSIEARFREEQDKSKLINSLLEGHYGVGKRSVSTSAQSKDVRSSDDAPVRVEGTISHGRLQIPKAQKLTPETYKALFTKAAEEVQT